MATASSHTAPSPACLSSGACVAYLTGNGDAPSARDLHEHLDHCERCRVLVAETAGAMFANGVASRATVRTLGDGEKVGGRYEILGFIARGGMGEVYEAFDLILREKVALKTLSPTTLDQKDATERLIAEVRLARKVTHVNVCRVLEFGLHHVQQDAGVEVIPVLTMELLHGETLRSRLRRTGRLDPDHALSVLEEISRGLGAVHDAGIVHRDFKPENVFLVRGPGDSERAVVMDFGLARALEANRGLPGSSTGAMIGTVAYMAPEQVEGQPPTPAFDVYALGVVAFEMLTGQLPFVADSALTMATSRLRQEPRRPSSLRPDLPPVWDAVIGRCLARDPRRRFRSVHDVIAALERTSPASSRRRGWLSPPRVAFMTLGLLLVGATVGGATAVRRRARRPADRPAAVMRLPDPAPAVSSPPVVRPAVTAATPAASETCEPARAAGGRVTPEPRARRRGRLVPAAPGAVSEAGRPPLHRAQGEGDDDLIDPFLPTPAPR